MKTLIKNIKEIVGISRNQKINSKAGEKLKEILTIRDGWIMLENNTISDFGNMEEWKGVDNWNEIEIIDYEEIKN